MRPPTLLILAAFIAVLLPGPSPASAEDETAHDAARSLAHEGAELFDQGDFQAALDKFKQAYDRFPSPKLFLNIGQSLRHLSRNVEALEAFERFLAEAKDANPEFVEAAKSRVAELKGKLSSIGVACNRTDASLMLDGQDKGKLPLDKPIIVEPGTHKLSVTWEGETKSVEIASVAGQELSQTFEFPEKKPPTAPIAIAPKPEPQVLPALQVEPTAAEVPAARSHVWYWVAGGAVLAAVGTTLVILYARSDRYPDASLGTRKLGDVR